MDLQTENVESARRRSMSAGWVKSISWKILNRKPLTKDQGLIEGHEFWTGVFGAEEPDRYLKLLTCKLKYEENLLAWQTFLEARGCISAKEAEGGGVRLG